jgi:hypothetical protein
VNNNFTTGKHVVTPDELPVERNLQDFIYESIDASSFVNVNAWSAFFNEIPVDPYIKDGYRYKAIAWFRIKHSKATAINEIDERILAVNKLSGLSEEESNQYTSNSKPAWKSKETGYECWNLPQ